jgi:hypothetical protein
MRRNALLLSVCLVVSIPAFAQQASMSVPAPQLFYVHEEIAKPSMLAPYEQTTKEFGAMMRDNTQPPFVFDAYSTDDFHYYFVLPMKSFADIDATQRALASVAQKMPEKFGDLMRRGGATMDHSNEWIVRLRPDLSYWPDQPRVKAMDARSMRLDFYYLQPGTEVEVDGIAKAWISAQTEKKITNGYNLYEAVMGADLPLVIVQFFGSSDADIANASMQDVQKLGEQGMALNTRTFANVRHFETKYVKDRPDLSTLHPAAAATK